MADYKDIKLDAELRDIAEDIANETYGTDFGSIKSMGHEAVILWIIVRAPDDVVDDVLDQFGYASRSALIDAVADRQFGGRFDVGFDPVEAFHTPPDMNGDDTIRRIEEPTDEHVTDGGENEQ